ncbi:hypothetical protein BJ742DRAFT_771976 [Cladochytrium replicatum]|nr:hypothetical protein BJ742DRAFT_771976 [Cladochytrium replicatum]
MSKENKEKYHPKYVARWRVSQCLSSLAAKEHLFTPAMRNVSVLIALLALASPAYGAVAFRAPGADEYRSGQVSVGVNLERPPPSTSSSLVTLFNGLSANPSAQTGWTPIAPPVVDSDGYVYYMLAAAAYTSPPQTFLKLAVLNFGGSTNSENVAANAGVVADINVGGAYSLNTADGRPPAWLTLGGKNSDTACLFWVATDASFRPTDVSVYSVFVGKTFTSSGSLPTWSTFSSIPWKFGPTASAVLRPTLSLDRTFAYMVSQGVTTSAATGAAATCLLRFNIEAGTRTGTNVTECKDIIDTATAAPAGLTVGAPTDIAPLSPLLSAVYSGLGYADGGANQMMLLSSSVGDVMFNVSWGLLPFSLSTLAAPSASSGIGGGGGSPGSNLQIRTASSWIDGVVALNADGVALRRVDRLSPQRSSVVWSATNAQIGHTPTLAKSIVALDEIRGWIYLCVNMTRYSVPASNSTNSAIGGPFSGFWNGTLVGLNNATGGIAFSSSEPIRGCSNDSVLIFPDNALLVSSPNAISMYQITSSNSIVSKWQFGFSGTSQPNLVPPALRNTTLLVGPGQLANLAFTPLPSPSPQPTAATSTPTPDTGAGLPGWSIAVIVIAAVAVAAAAAVVLLIRRRRMNKGGDKHEGDEAPMTANYAPPANAPRASPLIEVSQATTAVSTPSVPDRHVPNKRTSQFGASIFSVFPHSRHNQSTAPSSRGGSTVGYIGDDDADDIHMEELSEVSRVGGGSSAASEVGTVRTAIPLTRGNLALLDTAPARSNGGASATSTVRGPKDPRALAPVESDSDAERVFHMAREADGIATQTEPQTPKHSTANDIASPPRGPAPHPPHHSRPIEDDDDSLFQYPRGGSGQHQPSLSRSESNDSFMTAPMSMASRASARAQGIFDDSSSYFASESDGASISKRSSQWSLESTDTIRARPVGGRPGQVEEEEESAVERMDLAAYFGGTSSTIPTDKRLSNISDVTAVPGSVVGATTTREAGAIRPLEDVAEEKSVSIPSGSTNGDDEYDTAPEDVTKASWRAFG